MFSWVSAVCGGGGGGNCPKQNNRQSYIPSAFYWKASQKIHFASWYFRIFCFTLDPGFIGKRQLRPYASIFGPNFTVFHTHLKALYGNISYELRN